jgi:hypothetical protein
MEGLNSEILPDRIQNTASSSLPPSTVTQNHLSAQFVPSHEVDLVKEKMADNQNLINSSDSL